MRQDLPLSIRYALAVILFVVIFEALSLLINMEVL